MSGVLGGSKHHLSICVLDADPNQIVTVVFNIKDYCYCCGCIQCNEYVIM